MAGFYKRFCEILPIRESELRRPYGPCGSKTAPSPVLLMSPLKGPVRFRFRAPEDDVDVLIQGDAEWVNSLREDLGLIDVGWVQPMATTGRAINQESESNDEPDESDEDSLILLQSDVGVELPGPPPDPSRVPTVRRIIGEMDLDAEMEKLGIEQPRSPTAEELSDIICEMDEPEPITSQVSTDPMAEAWLQRLMRVAVRKFGVTALPISVIDSAACEQLDRSGTELELWLEGMWRLGKLVKVDGGGRFGYGPSPRWLEAD